MLPPNGLLTSGTYDIFNVVNKRKNCTRSGWHLGPSSSSSFLLLLRRSRVSIGLCGVCGPSSPGFIYNMTSPTVFLSVKMTSAPFSHNTLHRPISFFPALLGCKSFKTTRDTLGLAIKKAVNFMSNMKWGVNIQKHIKWAISFKLWILFYFFIFHISLDFNII